MRIIKVALVYLFALIAPMLLASETPEAENRLPGAYKFLTPTAKETWKQHLPEGCVFVSPTCAYNKNDKTIYLLAEFCGLSEGYEIEFILLGRLSDRAYESTMIAWDDPSAIRKAAEALGLPLGEAANIAQGMPAARGERFTVEYAPLNDKQVAFKSIAEEVDDQSSTAAQNLFGRGFPYVGKMQADDYMPCAIIPTYTGCEALFGMPYFADKSSTYGLFRAKQTRPYGAPVIVALRWQQLPNGAPRVVNESLHLTKELIANPEAIVETLKNLSNNPADVFLHVSLDETLLLDEVVPIATLLLAIENEGGYTILPPKDNQLSIRAFVPKSIWLDREKRLFQPWEIEVTPGVDGAPASVTLCQIEEDWSGEGLDPLLTRHCYPNVKPETILSVMNHLDEDAGRCYVAFFYCKYGTRINDILPYVEAIKKDCPVHWIFINSKF